MAQAMEAALSMGSTQGSSGATLDGSALQQAEALEAGFVSATEDSAERILSATVTPLSQSAVQEADGTVQATVLMKTWMVVEDTGSSEQSDSGFNQTYLLTLTQQGSEYSVTAAQAVPTPEAAVDLNDLTLPAGPPSIDSALAAPLATDPGGGGPGGPAPPPTTPGYPTEHYVNTSDFNSYALKWTAPPYDGDQTSDFNSVYPVYDNNCSNFASQALDQSGWYLTGGNSLQQNDNSKWTYNLGGINGATRTWYQSAHLDIFAGNTGTYLHLKYLYNANAGDLLFTDWDPKGQPDGHIDHVMVVTGRTSNGVPKISQKTPNHHDITINQTMALAETQGRTKIVWYGLKNY